MHTIEILEINFKVDFPSEMQEFTNDQFVFLAGLMLKMHAGEINLTDLYTAMILKILGVTNGYNDYDRLTDEAKLFVSDNVNRMADLLNFVFAEDDGKISLNMGFTRNFVPHLAVKNVRTWYGPADALTDCTFLEYKDAGTYYRTYLKTNDESDLNRLVAVLYRPKDWRGNKIAYNADLIESRATKIVDVPLAKRFAIFLFFQSIENYLRTATLEVDGQEISLELLYETTLIEKQKNKPVKYENKTGLAGVALSLAATGIFGPIERVYSQNLYDVLLLLYKQRVEYLNQLENTK